jgi:hypothetical protein
VRRRERRGRRNVRRDEKNGLRVGCVPRRGYGVGEVEVEVERKKRRRKKKRKKRRKRKRKRKRKSERGEEWD